MKDHKFSCPNCDEPFDILLPDETTRTGNTECDVENQKYHNLKHPTQCPNCEQINTTYYCTEGHPSAKKMPRIRRSII